MEIATQKATQCGREADLTLNLAREGVKIVEQDLRKIAEEIIDNAFKFSEIGTPVQIKAVIDTVRFIALISTTAL